MIKNVSAFIEEVLPAFFKHGNLSSFVRQVRNIPFSLICTISVRRGRRRGSMPILMSISRGIIRKEIMLLRELYNQIKRRIASEQQEAQGQLALK